MQQSRRSLAMATLAVAAVSMVGVTHAETVRFTLVPASTTIATCLPQASAEITVFLKEEIRGVDTLS